MGNRSLILIIGIAIVVVAAGIYYMSTSSGPNGESVTPTEIVTSPKFMKGEALYVDYCSGCHGAKRDGGVGPALSASNADRSVIENGDLNEGMPAFKEELSPEEIDAIIDYLSS
ncbi:hypothetical protein E2P64_03475 [Candidatus Bathyarchaeota archaeon]|nr:hypothetical protein E2P64_03475 [Candidatus Bathyarchaeota archaeon]